MITGTWWNIKKKNRRKKDLDEDLLEPEEENARSMKQFGKASAEDTLPDGQNVRQVKIADDRVETMTKLTT